MSGEASARGGDPGAGTADGADEKWMVVGVAAGGAVGDVGDVGVVGVGGGAVVGVMSLIEDGDDGVSVGAGAGGGVGGGC
jgi:hypothetical protein